MINLLSEQEDLMFSAFKEKSFPITELIDVIYNKNIENGWWPNLYTSEPNYQNKKELCGLFISEIFEAFEGERKDSFDSHLIDRLSAEVEIADFFIRIFSYCGKYEIDPFGYFLKTMVKNSIFEEVSLLDSFLPEGNNQKLSKLISVANNCGIPFYTAQIEQFQAYQKYCYQRTSITDIDGNMGNRFESLLKITFNLSKISELNLEINNNEKTFDAQLEEQYISTSLAMMLDYASHMQYDIGEAIVEKFTYNSKRVDHKLSSRKKSNGKKN